MKQSILLVDDSPTIRHILTDFLGKNGFECVAVSSAEEALSRFQQTTPATMPKPNLVIVDLELSGPIHGNQLIFSLQALPFTGKIVVCSSTRPVLSLFGISAWIQKPFELEVFLAAVKQVLTS